MPTPTTYRLRDLLQGVEEDIAGLDALSAVEGDGAPTRAESSAIARVHKAMRQLMTTLKAEVADLG